MKLFLNPETAEKIKAHAAQAYPEECCGLLIGAVPEDFGEPGARLHADQSRPLANAWEGGAAGKRTRYSLDPLQFAKIERDLAATGRGVIGIYHSHPDVAAWPSPFDLDHAWPSYAYLIVSVRGATIADERVWLRSEDGRAFTEGIVEVTPAQALLK
jgi:proteasome lid subunit RPN8/RPN11